VTEGPKNKEVYKGQSGCGSEHSRDLPWEPKGLGNKRKPDCGTERNLSLVGETGHKHKRVREEQDQSVSSRTFKEGVHRHEDGTKSPGGATQGQAPMRRLCKNLWHQESDRARRGSWKEVVTKQVWTRARRGLETGKGGRLWKKFRQPERKGRKEGTKEDRDRRPRKNLKSSRRTGIATRSNFQ
jgi:hypothetical protein